MGLSKLLTNIAHFEDVIPLTKVGSRKELDITVGDIYGGILSPIDNSLTASNFGKVAITDSNYNSSDILATVQGLVGEVVTALSLQFAETKNIDHIIYIGSTLCNNIHLQNIISSYTKYQNKTPIFLRDGGNSGAIGALLHATNKKADFVSFLQQYFKFNNRFPFSPIRSTLILSITHCNFSGKL